MAAGTDLSRPFTILEARYYKDNGSNEICENSEDFKKMRIGKPPRHHLTVIRRNIGSAMKTGVTDLVSKYILSE